MSRDVFFKIKVIGRTLHKNRLNLRDVSGLSVDSATACRSLIRNGLTGRVPENHSYERQIGRRGSSRLKGKKYTYASTGKEISEKKNTANAVKHIYRDKKMMEHDQSWVSHLAVLT